MATMPCARPAVHVAQEDAERHRAAEVEHAVVGLGGGGHVVEHQQDAGHDQDQEEEQRHQAEAERVDGPQSVAVDLDGVEVEEEVGEAGGRALQIVWRAADCGRWNSTRWRAVPAHGGPHAFFVAGVLIRLSRSPGSTCVFLSTSISPLGARVTLNQGSGLGAGPPVTLPSWSIARAVAGAGEAGVGDADDCSRDGCRWWRWRPSWRRRARCRCARTRGRCGCRREIVRLADLRRRAGWP